MARVRARASVGVAETERGRGRLLRFLQLLETATYSNARQHTATHSNTVQTHQSGRASMNATHSNTLQHAAAH